MTEKNEAIARWMGWTDIRMWAAHPSLREQPVGNPPDTRWVAELPAYHESLDALVPVMEALRGHGCEAVLRAASRQVLGKYVAHVDGFAENYSGATGHYWADEPAEALRDAIYAALVAMGEVTE